MPYVTPVYVFPTDLAGRLFREDRRVETWMFLDRQREAASLIKIYYINSIRNTWKSVIIIYKVSLRK